jgi:hypothetical protein
MVKILVVPAAPRMNWVHDFQVEVKPVVRQFAVPGMKRISFCSAQALRFGMAGWFVARRKMLAGNVNGSSSRFQEREFGPQKNSSRVYAATA